MRPSSLFSWLLACVLCSLPSCAMAVDFAERGPAVAEILTLLDERLSLMPDVAAWKRQHHANVRDAQREQQVIEGALSQAAPLGISRESVRLLFRQQIDLAATVQESLLAQWRDHGAGAPSGVRNLENVIRPRLDQITHELLVAIYLAASELQRSEFVATYATAADEKLQASGWTAASRAETLRNLALVRLEASDTIERIRASGVLRIGTTGDYAPFSAYSPGNLSGVDVELAQSLAETFTVKAVFIRTSWPTLMDDLRRHQFDIALSGISVTPARRMVAAFSMPYFSGGKTIIARCRDRRRFRNLKAVDRSGVRVIVNPGGTNAQYVREHLHHADIHVFPDNRGVFEEIRANRADVMITDDVEVDWQTRQHSDLCRTFAGTLTRADKAVLMAQDAGLVAAVDAWLVERIRAGEISRLLGRPATTP